MIRLKRDIQQDSRKQIKTKKKGNSGLVPKEV